MINHRRMHNMWKNHGMDKIAITNTVTIVNNLGLLPMARCIRAPPDCISTY